MSTPNLDGIDGSGSSTSANGTAGAGSYITDIRTISEATQTAINKIDQGNITFGSKSPIDSIVKSPIALVGILALGALIILK